MAEIAAQVVDGLGDQRDPSFLAEHLIAVHVGADQLCLVVQHLLEVGDEPTLVDRVPAETTADVVVHPARSHRVERVRHDEAEGVAWSVGVAAEQDLELCRRRELGCWPETAPFLVERVGKSLQGSVDRAVTRQLGLWRERLAASHGIRQCLGVLRQLVAPVRPRIADGSEQLQELRLREVRAAVERLAVGGGEHGHRPAATSRHRLDRLHVDGVDVGALLPIDLDVDEAGIHRPPPLRRLRTTRGP